ncbi:MAG: dual specificity protein phosphatase family protein [Deltaproteobacteria bacterium]|nr:dual specificity protein phosphatase family protein [Candidatus Zymogenaceae bacterium]
MDFILDRLAIGDLGDAKNEEILEKSGITAILNVAQEAHLEPDLARFDYYKVSIDDGQAMDFSHLSEAVEYIHTRIRRGKVLVHCLMGVSRSSTIVLCYLHECGFSLREAMNLIKRKRPDAQPHIALYNSVREYYLQKDEVA